MKAAVVSQFDFAPRYEDFESPVADGSHELVVDVIAAGLHPRVRSQANGSHYTSTDELPLIPGIDGVGRGADGLLRYFILPDSTRGSMAEHTVIDVRRSIVLPEGSDPIAIAAAMNPAMSSWIALKRRIGFTAGQSVLVLGATGSAGRLAVQVAKHLGAKRVIASGRNPERLVPLPRLGADDIVDLDAAATAGSNVDVVLDYLWGEPAAQTIAGIIRNRQNRATPLTWIEIGSAAGLTAPLPSAAFRAANLQLIGSGQGSVATAEILAELPAVARAIAAGAFTLDTTVVPLANVEQAWADAATSALRIVVTP